MSNTFGNRLACMLADESIPAPALANKLGVSLSTVEAWLTDRAVPQGLLLERLASQIWATPEELLGAPLQLHVYETLDAALPLYAVVAAKADGAWLVRRERETGRILLPFAARDPGESIATTAARVLNEQLGGRVLQLSPVCGFTVASPDRPDDLGTFCALFVAETDSPTQPCERLPANASTDDWAFPLIHPLLLSELQRRGLA